MLSRKPIAHVGIAAIALLALGAQAAGPVAQPVYKAEQLSRQRFKTLPDSAVIERNGQRMTKAQIRAQAVRQQGAAAAQMEAATRQFQARVEQRRAQFLQRQQAQLAADNAKAMEAATRRLQADSTRQAGPRDAIEREAAQLFNRSRAATTADDRAQIERRATDLLRQLQQLGR
jgi:hypothetical protein